MREVRTGELGGAYPARQSLPAHSCLSSAPLAAHTPSNVYLCPPERPREAQVLALQFTAPIRSSAARAAHRELRSLLRLFPANYSWEIRARTPWRISNYRVVQTGGRARLSQAWLARNKRRSERSSRCAARAALDL